MNLMEIRPMQTSPIPWGWTNTQTPDGSLWVSHPLGRVEMPKLTNYFDFTQNEITYSKELLRPFPQIKIALLGMHSVFTTACRFLGTEEALIRLIEGTLSHDLGRISHHMYHWNRETLRHASNFIDIIIVGDEIGSTHGMLMNPDLYSVHIAPHHKSFVDLGKNFHIPVWYHADGDVSEIIPVLQDMGFGGIYYESVGGMESALDHFHFPGIKVQR